MGYPHQPDDPMPDTAENLLAAKDAEIERLRSIVTTDGVEKERLKAIALTCEKEVFRWNQDARRLSGGLLAINAAEKSVPASVLRSVAYDICLNCLLPEVAEYQITRRAALAKKPDTIAPAGTELSALWQAIVDHTEGKLFWIGEILLAELQKETGYTGMAPKL